MRGKQAQKRKILPDQKYHSLLVAKLINRVLQKGKKTLAQNIVYRCFDLIDEKIKKGEIEDLGDVKNAPDLFDAAIKNIAPVIEVRGKRIGGGNYQIPMPVRGNRKNYLVFTWLLDAAAKRTGLPMYKKLAFELIDAFHGTGAAIKKREDVHRMAESNKAFAHFAR